MGTIGFVFEKAKKEIISKGKETVKLSDFLKENHCYEEFILNFDREWHMCFDTTIINGCINRAFNWGKTEQGGDYWDTIDGKWRSIIEKEDDMKDFDFEKAKKELINSTSKKRHNTHYLKFDLNDILSVRYHFTFDDRPEFQNKWILKDHETKSYSIIDKTAVHMLVSHFGKTNGVEIYGSLVDKSTER